jgi:crossover junction endodeoxyribonuclease RusA
MQITLPWPPKELSPNARMNWAALAKIKAEYRKVCYFNAIEQDCKTRVFDKTTALPMSVTFYQPDRRHRDDDNMIQAFKSGRDGLADAFGVNDRLFRCSYFFPSEIGGMVVIEL